MDRLNDKHLQRLVKLLGIKLAQKNHKLTLTRKRNILMPIIKRLATYRADMYGDDEREVVRELKYLCGII